MTFLRLKFKCPKYEGRLLFGRVMVMLLQFAPRSKLQSAGAGFETPKMFNAASDNHERDRARIFGATCCVKGPSRYLCLSG